MGNITIPLQVKLFCSIIFNDRKLLPAVKKDLTLLYGEIDFESRMFPFNYTDYYLPEMGPDLSRLFITFSQLISPESLPEKKIQSNILEERISQNKKRPINIDPGYIALEKMILATTKNYSHRPYIANGIFADLTYMFTQESFQPLPWTYPDYREKEYIAMFNQLRLEYKNSLDLTNRGN